MKKIISMAILFTLSFGVSAYSQTKDALEKNLDRQIRQAEGLHLSYLPTYMKEQATYCLAYQNTEQKKECHAKLLQYGSQILQCPQSLQRYKEGMAYDTKLSTESFLTNPLAPIPEGIQKQLAKLEGAAKTLLDGRFPIRFQFAAYKSKVKNAHALVDGRIYMSSGLWESTPALTDEEVAAIIGHELTHVIAHHGMTLNCMALEWVGPQYEVSFAQEAFNEDLRGSERGDRWAQLSQKLEYEADRGSTKILKKAGLDPYLMAQALEKIRPKTEGGFATGSHPEFDVRIKAAQDAARDATARPLRTSSSSGI